MTWANELIEGHPGNDLALIDDDGTDISYAGLRDAVGEMVAVMRGHGVRPGDRCMIVAENTALVAVTLLAAARLRAWFVPVNARLSEGELDAIRDHATPRLTIFTTGVSENARAHAKRLGAMAGARVLGAPVVSCVAEAAVPEPLQDAPGTQVAALIYTSGTTGAPKGVMLSHDSLVFNARSAQKARDLTPGDRIALVLPLTHIMALSTALLAALSAGASVRLLSRFSVDTQLAALTEGDTIMPAVPQIYQQILSQLDAGEARLNAPALRQIGCGGAPLDPALKTRIETRFALPLTNGYGMTEAGPGIASTAYGPYRPDGSVGFVYPQCAVRVAMPDKAGIGELEFTGPAVMLGYYKNTDATTKAFAPDGWLRTGDLAKIDADGAIHIVGRRRELIIRSGFNVYPAEVEAALLACEGVTQAAVVGRPIADNEEIIAFVTVHGALAPEEISAALRRRLAPYKRPQHVIIVGHLPLTAAGKVKKHALVETYKDQLRAETT